MVVPSRWAAPFDFRGLRALLIRMGNEASTRGAVAASSEDSVLWRGVPEPILWLVQASARCLTNEQGILLHQEGHSTEGPVDEQLALEALAFDPQLQRVRDRLVGTRVMTEEAFFHSYFSELDALKHQITVDWLRAQAHEQQTRENVRMRWLGEWLALSNEDRVQLKRCAPVIAAKVGKELVDAGQSLAHSEAELGDYGQLGSFEVCKTVTEAFAGENGLNPEDLMYRVWCGGEALPTTVDEPVAAG